MSHALKLDVSSIIGQLPRYRENNTSNNLGKLIRESRRRLGISIEQLADMLKVCKNYVSLIELGKVGLSQSDVLLSRIASILYLDINELKALRPKRKLRRSKFIGKDGKPIINQWKNSTKLGRFIIKRRGELGFSQSDLAKLTDLPVTEIDAIESGTIKDPGILIISRIYLALQSILPKKRRKR